MKNWIKYLTSTMVVACFAFSSLAANSVDCCDSCGDSYCDSCGDSCGGCETIFSLALFDPVQTTNECDSIHGVRINLIYGSNCSLVGLDLGLINRLSNNMTGYQIGLVNLVGNDLVGYQVGAINQVCGNGFGSQHGIVNMVQGHFSGLQNAFLLNSACSVCGVQSAAINYTEEMTGFQFGIINYTNCLSGIQLGLINIQTSRPCYSVMPILNVSW